MRLFLVAALVCGPSLVHADPSKTPNTQTMHTDDCAKARARNKTCIIDMGKGTEIESDRPVNDEIKIDVAQFGKAASLVHIRRDFIVEILKTAEDL